MSRPTSATPGPRRGAGDALQPLAGISGSSIATHGTKHAQRSPTRVHGVSPHSASAVHAAPKPPAVSPA
jgi:hypothetical protein